MRHILGIVGFAVLWFAILLSYGEFIHPIGHIALHEGRMAVSDAVDRIGFVLTFPFSLLAPVLPSSLHLACFLFTALSWGAAGYFLSRYLWARWRRELTATA